MPPDEQSRLVGERKAPSSWGQTTAIMISCLIFVPTLLAAFAKIASVEDHVVEDVVQLGVVAGLALSLLIASVVKR